MAGLAASESAQQEAIPCAQRSRARAIAAAGAMAPAGTIAPAGPDFEAAGPDKGVKIDIDINIKSASTPKSTSSKKRSYISHAGVVVNACLTLGTFPLVVGYRTRPLRAFLQ